MQINIYGSGGFDATKPNNNLLEQYEIPDPEPTAEEIARQSAIDKLRGLGLTDDEIQALLP